MNNPELPTYTHDYLMDTRQQEKNTRLVVIITLVMMLAEIIGGWLFNSMAVLADGVHMGTHALALGLALLAYLYARRHQNNPAFPFGPAKVYDLGGFTSALMLLAAAVILVVESIERFLNPSTIQYTEAILVAVIGLAVNLISAFFLSGRADHAHDGHDHHDHAHEEFEHHAERDRNFRAAYLHVIADALTSILAIIALLLGWQLGWSWMDPIMGLVGAAVISKWSLDLLRDTARGLIGKARSTALDQELRETIEARAGDHVLDLHIWEISPGRNFAILSVASANPLSLSEYKAVVESFAAIVHSTIEIIHKPD